MARQLFTLTVEAFFRAPGKHTATSNQFTDYEGDSETGLDYAHARYYQPRFGRFMTVDPLFGDIGDPQSLNLYSYVRNNPINFIDPTGQECVTGADGIIRCSATGNSGGGSGGRGAGPIWDIVPRDEGGQWTSRPQRPTRTEPPSRVSYRSPQSPLEAVAQGTQMAEPMVNLAANVLRFFGWVVSSGMMAVAECAAAGEDCSAAGTALALIPGVGRLGNVGRVLPGRARTFGGASEAFAHLEKHHGISQELASARLHLIKTTHGIGPGENVLIDRTGGVWNPITREFLGSLTEGGARAIR
jgi:RHS repeat-associated protein